MLRIVKLALGLALLAIGLLGLLPYASPELPMTVAFKLRGLGEPVGTMARKWFEYSNYLQNARSTEYIGTLVLSFGSLVIGALTLIKGR